MGKDLTYDGFNGAVTGLIVGFGSRSYIHDEDALAAALT